MIHLCYANQTEALLQALGERLAAARARPGASLFDPVHLVVPNRNIETYVKLGLARAHGVAANIEARLLRGFLADAARGRLGAGAAATDGGETCGETGGDVAGDVDVIDRLQIQGELLGLLQDDRFLASRDLGPVRDYLTVAGTSGDAIDLRRFQLSAQLATLFDDYAFSRPEMLQAWRDGRLAEGPELTMQRWQRELWLGVFGRGGSLELRSRRDGRRRVTLAGLFDDAPALPLRLPPAVHVFGISYVARLYKRIFGALSQATELHIYTLNPCREFWEDLETGGRRPRPAERRKFPPRRSPEQLPLGALGAAIDPAPADDSDENPLLALWGRPGRDNIRLLNQLSDCDFDARFRDPLVGDHGGETAGGAQRPGTVLAQLQHDILNRVPARTGAARLGLRDDSVTVLACPDPRRELETIAAEIWRLVRASDDGAGPPLRWNEIAVLVPRTDAAARLGLASAVFREASELPHSVVDLPLGADSRVAEAIDLLLGLPLGSLGRPELLRLAMHPAVAGRFPDVDPSRWPSLCEDLGIVHGGDRQDHAGTYIDRDVFNWDQGLRRMALGTLMDGTGGGAGGGERRLFSAGGDRYLPAALPAVEQASATQFGLLLRLLLGDARYARTARLTLPEWMTFLRASIGRVVVAREPDDQAALLRCLAELQPLEDIGPPDLVVGYRVACELVRAALATLVARRGQYLADGVTVSSFLPMRAVPFRVIFIAGLGEGEFPTAQRGAPLDLRARAPRPGDVSPREQDQYMFLEALLCARERLYCSYVAADPLTGETRAPSSVLLDLLATLDAGIWADGAAAGATRQAPLRRHADPDVRAVFPAAAREHQAVALNDALLADLPKGTTATATPTLAEIREAAPAPAWRQLAGALGWAAPPALMTDDQGPSSASANAAASIILTTAELRRFLECPLQGSTRVLLRLPDADDDSMTSSREDEDFATRPNRTTMFLREVFREALAAGGAVTAQTLDQVYARQVEARTLDGTLPLGTFGQVAQAAHLEQLRAWLNGVRRLMPGELPPIAPLFYGHADEDEAAPRILPALTLEVPLPATPTAPARTVRVALHGRSELLADADQGGAGERVALLLPSGDRRDAGREQLLFLRAFLDHVVLSATDTAAAPRPTRALLCRPASAREQRLPEAFFLPLPAPQARAYLQSLVADLLGDVHPYLLPFEAVVSWLGARAKDPTRTVPETVTMLCDDNWTRFLSDFGPVPEPRNYPPPPDELARAIISRRLGPFFDGREGGFPGGKKGAAGDSGES